MLSLFDEFCAFAKGAPTPYNFCCYARDFLLSSGFTEIDLTAPLPEALPNRGFMINSNRSIFCYKDKGHKNGVVLASHSDAPCFILKPQCEEECEGMKKVRVANYGNGIWHTWVDRPLKLAGFVTYRTDCGLKTRVVDIDKPIGVIPSIAVHFRLANATNPVFNLEEHFCPLIGTEKASGLLEMVAQEIGIDTEMIVNHNLRFLPYQKPTELADGLFSAGMIDTLAPTFAALKAFSESEPSEGSVSGFVVFDNTAMGGMTKNGEATTFISDCLRMLCKSEEEHRVLKQNIVVVKCIGSPACQPGCTRESPHLGGGPCYGVTRGMSSSASVAGAIALSRVVCDIGCQLQQCKSLQPAVDDALDMLVIGIPILSCLSVRGLASLSDLHNLIMILEKLCSDYEKYQYIES